VVFCLVLSFERVLSFCSAFRMLNVVLKGGICMLVVPVGFVINCVIIIVCFCTWVLFCECVCLSWCFFFKSSFVSFFCSFFGVH